MNERPIPTEADEARHPVEPAPLFNESWYFDFAAPDGGFGGWVRLGLYPNLGIAWYNALVCGPEFGLVAFSDYAAPLPADGSGPVETAAFRAGLDAVEPLRRWRLTLDASARRLPDAAAAYLSDAGEACPLAFDLEWTTDGEPFHYWLTPRYEVPCVVTGSVDVGGERIAVASAGQRDHSWAVRDWWAFGWLWTAARLDDGRRLHASHIRVGDGMTFGYVQAPGATLEAVAQSTIAPQIGPDHLATADRLTLAPQGLDVAIVPLAHAPVLLRADDGRVSHFDRAMCRFDAADGTSGTGWTEWNMPAPLG